MGEIDITGYEDEHDFLHPICDCGGYMGYNYDTMEFMCHECGKIIDANDIEADDERPSWCPGCVDAPYPECMSTCTLCDND